MADIGKIQQKEIVEEMRESYLDYAMSVIVSRALPDVRDGLKPVHRRILYAMHEMGLTHASKFIKCANIVGQTLGRYHPHGDTAVYDSLVRMAQDFSLRYPLINGQGNFGCFTKDTKVQLTDGRALNFEELIHEDRTDKKNYTYTVNKLGLIAIAEIQKPRRTKIHTEITRVTLDNGEEIRCTPNHLFLLRAGSYQEARDLKPGDSLMPLYQRRSEKTDRLDRKGYTLIFQPQNNQWVPAHHLADNYNLTNKKYRVSRGRVRHHIDFNKLNNNPDNITRVRWGEHWKIHYTQASRQHQNHEYREKIRAGREKYWASEEHREQQRKRLSERNIKNWFDPIYREKMRKMLREVNIEYVKQHPEKRIELSQRLHGTLKRLWQDPSYQMKMRQNIIKGNKHHTINKTGRLKFLNIAKAALETYPILNEKSYEAARTKIYPYGAATLWETGIKKYFQNNPDLVRQEINNNHQILHVTHLAEHEDVYDLTIEGTHNFALASGVFVHNSIDGDSAAAYRYTEARMTRTAEELLRDIEKDTVDFRDNYDGTRKEPVVLPTVLPNLLLNGTLGIAVGMATNIPPHNLGEVVDALTHLVDHPRATSDDLMEFVKGPDFPTGGIIFDEKEIRASYAVGKGAILNRGKAEVEEGPKNYQIIITEIPYQVNKSELIETVANLVQEKRLEGIRDIRDESDKDGMRIVIELKTDAHPQKILNNLYRYTDLEKNFHINMLALVDGIQPQVLSIKSVLEEFIKHRNVVVVRRTKFDLAKTRDRIHILEGLKKALDHIDRVIETIKKSRDREEAQINLIKKFDLSDLQATAILEMRLQTLAGLERQKIENELKEKTALAKSLEALLRDPKKIFEVIKTELRETREKYGDERKTKVIKTSPKEFSEEDLIPDEEAVVVITRGGYIKRIKPESYRIQKRGGKGLMGMETKEEDVVEHLLSCSTHAELLFFSNSGKVYQVRAYEIPEGTRISKGKAIFNFLSLGQQERISAVLAIPKTKKGEAEGFIVMITKNGIIKKVESSSFENVRKSGLIAVTLKKDDSLIFAKLTSGSDEMILVTRKGQAIRFTEKDVRPMGRQAAGVRAMRLKKDDEIVGMDVITTNNKRPTTNDKLLVVTENGYGKQTLIKQFKKQRRGGSGIKCAKITSKTGNAVGAYIIGEEETELIAISRKGQVIRTGLPSIPVLGRATQGVRIMRMDTGEAVASITTL